MHEVVSRGNNLGMARLPSLPSLRALEAAARHGSYSKAARELNLTHGAVSQQLRALEQTLGVTLFTRRGNAMLPTPAAAALAGVVTKAFGDLEAAIADVAQSDDCAPLVLSVGAQFASRWLAPRLASLSAAQADLEIRVDDHVADFVTDGVDIAVRHGTGGWPGLHREWVLREVIYPVCSPAFAARHRISAPADLLRVPLLRHTWRSWSTWFDVMGLTAPPQSGLQFDDSLMLIDAAVQGLGVGLARSGLVEADIAEGRLMRPVPGEIDAGSGFHIVWRPDSRKLPRIRALRDWMLAEAGAVAVAAA